MATNCQNLTGWELERRAHFDEIVAGYDEVRPGYPRELFDDIFGYVGSAIGKTALEIGAGTGKATAPVLDAGYAVTAVELGGNMAEFLRGKFRGREKFSVIQSDFESCDLPNDNYDLIYAGTAFHWVKPEIGCPKAFGLLKSGGAIALFRYNALPSIGLPLYEAIQEVYEKYYYSFYKSNKRPVMKTHEDFSTPAEIKHGFGFESLADYGFGDVQMKFYDVTRSFTADEFVAIRDTFSDHRGLPEGCRTALYAGLRGVVNEYGGRVCERYVFQLWLGRKM